MDGNDMVNLCFRRPAATTAVLAIVGAIILGTTSGVKSEVTQFHTAHRCVACHNGMSTRSGEDISFGLAWRPTMMANSSRDPYWQAGVRHETMDHPKSQQSIEDECAICHMPMARFESRQAGRAGRVFAHLSFLPQDRSDLLAADGVSCALCHQITAAKLGSDESFTGGFHIDPPDARGQFSAFGPYSPNEGHIDLMHSSTGGFRPTESTHISSSEVCAVCHTLITKSLGPGGEVITDFPEQVPYQEWQHSVYRKTRSCQSCHMPVVVEPVAATSVLGEPRTGVSRHTFSGGNFFVTGILNRHRSELSVQAMPDELAQSARRTQAHLREESAVISLANAKIAAGRMEIEITIENRAGHKFPTAYPSRRVWLHVIVRDRDDRIIFESGAFKANGAIAGNDNDEDATRFEPHYDEICSADQVQIYEAILGDGNGKVTTGLLHAVGYLKDNRLLPRGFDKKRAGKNIAVVGSAAGDENFAGGGDRVRYSVALGKALGPFRVEVELWYQPVSYRWAMNLRSYDARETRRIVQYFEEAAPSSALVVARSERSGVDNK